MILVNNFTKIKEKTKMMGGKMKIYEDVMKKFEKGKFEKKYSKSTKNKVYILEALELMREVNKQ